MIGLFEGFSNWEILTDHDWEDTVNPFQPNITFLYPLKMSENIWFSDVFVGYRIVTLD